jgi:glucokinase
MSIGIDVGGTSVKGVRLTPDGAVEASAESVSTPDNPDLFVATIIDQAKQLGAGPGTPVGVAVAAFVDPTRRIVQFSPNISWTMRPLAEEMENHLGVAVHLDNDANAACYAEYHTGAGKGATSLAMFTLGTGVGGAVMVDGQLLVGARGAAGELGHLPAPSSLVRCGCGGVGCVETVASGTAIVTRVRELTGTPEASVDEITAVLGGDADLRNQIFDEVALALAHAIVSVQAVTNPDTVILGGGVMDRAGPSLLTAVRKQLDGVLSGRHFSLAPQVLPAALGNRAGAIGAALLAAHRQPSSQ